MRKIRHKVRNGQNLAHESPNFTNNFFQSDFTYNLSQFSTGLRPYYQNSFFEIFFLFSVQNSRMSKNMFIWRHKLCNSKTGVGPTFTWSNEPWSTKQPWGYPKFGFCHHHLWLSPTIVNVVLVGVVVWWCGGGSVGCGGCGGVGGGGSSGGSSNCGGGGGVVIRSGRISIH